VCEYIIVCTFFLISTVELIRMIDYTVYATAKDDVIQFKSFPEEKCEFGSKEMRESLHLSS